MARSSSKSSSNFNCFQNWTSAREKSKGTDKRRCPSLIAGAGDGTRTRGTGLGISDVPPVSQYLRIIRNRSAGWKGYSGGGRRNRDPLYFLPIPLFFPSPSRAHPVLSICAKPALTLETAILTSRRGLVRSEEADHAMQDHRRSQPEGRHRQDGDHPQSGRRPRAGRPPTPLRRRSPTIWPPSSRASP